VRVAIDARSLSERATSNRTYWAELVAALGRRSDVELLLFSNAPIPAADIPANAKAIIAPSKGRWFSLVVLPALAHRYQADVVHVQYSVSPLFRTPVVTMVHDVSFLIEPSWFGWKDRTLLRFSVPRACRRAARVVVPSETCKRELLERISVAESKVIVTPLAVSTRLLQAVPDEGGLKELVGNSPFVLLVGGGGPRKNLAAAVAAVGKAREGIADLKLVVTGGVDTALPEWVIAPGPIAEGLLSAAYRGAHALLHPSFHEGFGLTVLEAMALGCPVITSDRGSIPEVAGGAALLYDVNDSAGMAAGILNLAGGELRAAQIAKGRARAAEFDWDRTATLTVEAYRNS